MAWVKARNLTLEQNEEVLCAQFGHPKYLHQPSYAATISSMQYNRTKYLIILPISVTGGWVSPRNSTFAKLHYGFCTLQTLKMLLTISTSFINPSI